VIVYASSVIGVHKLYLPSLHIGYRTHPNNSYLNRQISLEEKNRRERALYQLFDWYASRFATQIHPTLIQTLLEFISLSKIQRKRHAVPNPIKLTYKWLQSKQATKN